MEWARRYAIRPATLPLPFRPVSIDRAELRRLNQLLGAALLDEQVCRQLIQERDTTLFDQFDLRDETQVWLRGLQVASLEELAHLILSAHQGAKGGS